MLRGERVKQIRLKKLLELIQNNPGLSGPELTAKNKWAAKAIREAETAGLIEFLARPGTMQRTSGWYIKERA